MKKLLLLLCVALCSNTLFSANQSSVAERDSQQTKVEGKKLKRKTTDARYQAQRKLEAKQGFPNLNSIILNEKRFLITAETRLRRDQTDSIFLENVKQIKADIAQLEKTRDEITEAKRQQKDTSQLINTPLGLQLPPHPTLPASASAAIPAAPRQLTAVAGQAFADLTPLTPEQIEALEADALRAGRDYGTLDAKLRAAAFACDPSLPFADSTSQTLEQFKPKRHICTHCKIRLSRGDLLTLHIRAKHPQSK